MYRQASERRQVVFRHFPGEGEVSRFRAKPVSMATITETTSHELGSWYASLLNFTSHRASWRTAARDARVIESVIRLGTPFSFHVQTYLARRFSFSLKATKSLTCITYACFLSLSAYLPINYRAIRSYRHPLTTFLLTARSCNRLPLDRNVACFFSW
jgi:hypothetical protein